MLDINKYRRINEEAKNKQQEIDKQTQSRVDKELSIIESVIDSEIEKNKSMTCVIVKMDLHSRAVEELRSKGFLVNFNYSSDEYAISWSEDATEEQVSNIPVSDVVDNLIGEYRPNKEHKYYVADRTIPSLKITFDRKDERTATKDDSVEKNVVHTSDILKVYPTIHSEEEFARLLHKHVFGKEIN